MDSPIVTATWQAGVLSAISNILAQLLTSWRTDSPLSLHPVDVFQFALFAVLITPPNVVWQAWIEAQFPAYGERLLPQQKEALIDDRVTGKTTTLEKKGEEETTTTGNSGPVHDSANRVDGSTKKLNKRNTAIKLILDQTLGAVVNNLLFIAGIGLIRGKTMNSIQTDIYGKFMPTMMAGLKFWPLVSLLNFTLVPLESRMLLGNTAGLFWGIFLSLTASSG